MAATFQWPGGRTGPNSPPTLVQRGGGADRLFLDGAVRAAAGMGEGDEVTVEVRVDDDPDRPLPSEFADALQRHEGVPEALARLPTGLRREMIRWVAAAKRESTRLTRIERAIDELRRRAEPS